MLLASHAPLVVLILFVGMLLFLEAGRRLGVRRRRRDPESSASGLGVVEGAIFALLGLMIAFTFSAAASRFDARRALVIEEANAVGTAWLRLDVLPAPAQPGLRDLFRRYVDTRIEVYRKLPDVPAARAELRRSNALQGEIWARAVAACREAPSPAVCSLVLPALNEMIDITTTRTWAALTHTPGVIFAMLAVFGLAGALLAGFAMSGANRRSRIHELSFVFLLAATFYVIVDLEYPRVGLIRLNDFDEVLLELRRSMD
jgi:hypothetical protein